MIGEVILDNLFEVSDLSREATVWKDIHCATTVSNNATIILFLFDLWWCIKPISPRLLLE
jgi:hypothetical protein